MKEIRWDNIFGHEVQKRRLEDFFSVGMPHCLLFVGQDGIGKKMIAERLARVAWCQSDKAPCGECEGCKDFAKRGMFLVAADTVKIFSIDEVRFLKDKLEKTDFSGNLRVVIVDNVHLLSKIVANALLKILEEPAKNIVFILIASDAYSVLPTIKSRSLMMRFDKLKKADIEKMVIAWGETDLNKNWSILISGQPGLIKKIFFGNAQEITGKMISFWKMLMADYWVKSEITKKVSSLEKEKIIGVIFFWEICLRSYLLWKHGMEKFCWWHEKELLEWYNNCNLTCDQVVRLLGQLGDLRNMIANNYNKKIQIFNFLLES